MARLAREMLSDALEAFIRGDAAGGRDVCLRDDKVDALNRSVFRILLTHMMEDPAPDRRRDGTLPGVAGTSSGSPTWPPTSARTWSSWSRASPSSTRPRTGAKPEPRDRGQSAGLIERFGAIDVGSNSIRLLVAEWDPAGRAAGRWTRSRTSPGSATGLAATGRLDDAAMDRALAALERMRDVAERRGVNRLDSRRHRRRP